MIALLFCLVIIVATYVFIQDSINKWKKFPTGPYGLPFVGYHPFFGKNPVKTMTNLRRKYGNVFSVKVGLETIVILNDLKAVKEAFLKQSSIFSGRPVLPMQSKIFSKDIIFEDGLIWKEQRHLSLRILRDFGFGRSSLESKIMFEVDQLTNFLNENAGKPIDISTLFLLPVLNVIWNITAGKRFEEINDFLQSFQEFMHHFSVQSNYSLLNTVPFLRFIIPSLSKQYEGYLNGSNKLIKHLEQEVDNHISNFNENNLKDFIDAYLEEINQRKKHGGVEVPPYNREHLVRTIVDLFVAGEETTDLTLSWTLLHMINRPDIQRKVQEELDVVVTKESYLSLSSKSLAPYSEATLMEMQRHPTLVPLVVHRTLKDSNLLGFKLPKNTRILANIYAVHHDERYWDDPETFRPERFLDETGRNIIKHESYIPFSIGPRSCIAESMVRFELHLMFTSLLRRFTFEAVPGEEMPSLEPISGGMFKPIPYSFTAKPRS